MEMKQKHRNKYSTILATTNLNIIRRNLIINQLVMPTEFIFYPQYINRGRVD